MKLPFMPETWSTFLPALAAGGALLAAGAHWGSPALEALGGLLLAAAALVLNFFRDFERRPGRALKDGEVLSPADGKVVVLQTIVEEFHLKEPMVHIAVFMNPLNNHVQRAPFDGEVVEKSYHPGKFLAAYEDKADLVNEQSHLVVELAGTDGKGAPRGRMVIKQIAGLLCHRVRTTPGKGERIVRGERIGRILLGSRVDVFLPEGFQPSVKLGDQVRAGVTRLGEFQ